MDRRLIYYICDDLDIDVPKIKEVDSLPGTMLAAYHPNTNELQVIKRYETFYDFVFVLAHELRHKYQIDNGWDFSNYTQRDKTDLITYNLQVQELDANAYGFIFMVNEFGVKPLFKGMDEQIKNAIMERVEYLIKTEYE